MQQYTVGYFIHIQQVSKMWTREINITENGPHKMKQLWKEKRSIQKMYGIPFSFF